MISFFKSVVSIFVPKGKKLRYKNIYHDAEMKSVDAKNAMKVVVRSLLGYRRLAPKVPIRESFVSKRDWYRGSRLKYVWFGHSSILLRIAQKTVFFDPVLSNRMGPFHINKRFFPLKNSVTDLPHVDLVLISHSHYDHLCRKTVQQLIDHDPIYVIPKGLREILESWGVKPHKIKDLEWWESIQMWDLMITFTPAQHSSGRMNAYGNLSLWGSWCLQTETNSVFFSGDSGYSSHFKMIAQKYSGFDAVFVETGQYHKDCPYSHMTPEDAAKAFRELKGKAYIPIHWGSFALSEHHWFEPIKQIKKISQEQNFKVSIPTFGRVNCI